MKQKVALFDIDKTIISIDSMFHFLLFGFKRKPSTIFNLVLVVVYTVLYKLKFVKLERAKEPFFHAITFLSDEDLEKFYLTVLTPNIYSSALNELKIRKEEGCHIILVTASPYAYMKFFKTIPYVDAVMGTDLKLENGKYKNKIVGLNCKGEEKVCRILAYLEDNDLDIDFNHSYAYSDSLTDRPMFSLVKNNYLINKKHPGLEDLTWKY
ncbi:HAD-IB family hydrolase [Neobacillus sp. K501]